MRKVLTLIIGLLAATHAARADMLSGDDIRRHFAGARIVGVNDLESPYTIWFSTRGTLKGMLGTHNQFDDRGRWWVKGNRLCMHWELWLMGKPTCYDVALEGARVTRMDANSRTVIRSTLVHGD
jgi:hypothetical protein